METRVRYIFVGSFLIVAALCFAAALLWYSRGTSRTDADFYAIYFRNHSLSGMQVGSAVTMRGIKVGRVETVKIPAEQDDGVRVEVSVDRAVPINKKTHAVIERNVLTGLASVELKTLEQASVASSPADETLTVIAEGRGQLDIIKSSLSETVANLNRTLLKAQALFDEENQQSLSSILQNVKQVTDRLAKEESGLNRLQQEMTHMIKLSETVLQKVGGNFSDLSLSLEGTSDVISREIVSATQALQLAAEKISRTLDSYDDPRKILLGPSRNQLGPGE